MNKVTKDILVRSAKTFIEAFGGVFFASLAVLSFEDFGALKKLFFSALASGIAAVLTVLWNSVSALLETKLDIDDEQIEKDIEEALAELDKDKEDEADG